MVFIILQGCFPCLNVSIIRECKCTNGTYGSYYAHDLVLISDTLEELQKHLNALKVFCMDKDLLVNINKTKEIRTRILLGRGKGGTHHLTLT